MASVIHLAQALLPWLATGAIVAVVLPGVAWGIIRALRVRRAVTRHTIWLACMFGVTLVPLLRCWSPLTLDIPALPAPSPVPQRSHVTPTTGAESEEPTGTAPNGTAADKPGRLPPPRATAWLGVIWLLGVALLILRLGFHACALCWLGLRSRRRTDYETPDRLSDAETRVLISRFVKSPVGFGMLRPVIVLPEGFADDPARLDMALKHEHAHIERWDYLITLFQRIVEIVYFYHPAVWYCSHRLTQERELVCDYWVLAQGTQPDDYAECLLSLVRLGQKTPSLATAWHGAALRERVVRILDDTVPRNTHLSRVHKAAGITCSLLLYALAGTLHLTAAAPDTPSKLTEVAEPDKPEATEGAPPAPPAKPSPAPDTTMEGDKPEEDHGISPELRAQAEQKLKDLGSSAFSTRQAAITWLNETEPTPALRRIVMSALGPLTASSDIFIQRAARQAVGRWAGPDDSRLLLAMLELNDQAAWKSVVQARLRLSDDDLSQAVRERLGDFHFRAAAQFECNRLGAAAEPLMLDMLAHPNRFLRLAACRQLGNAGTTNAIPHLEKQLELAEEADDRSTARAIDGALRSIRFRTSRTNAPATDG